MDTISKTLTAEQRRIINMGMSEARSQHCGNHQEGAVVLVETRKVDKYKEDSTVHKFKGLEMDNIRLLLLYYNMTREAVAVVWLLLPH